MPVCQRSGRRIVQVRVLRLRLPTLAYSQGRVLYCHGLFLVYYLCTRRLGRFLPNLMEYSFHSENKCLNIFVIILYRFYLIYQEVLLWRTVSESARQKGYFWSVLGLTSYIRQHF